MVQEAKKANTGKVFLVLDNLKVHHAKLVKAWLQENKEHIEVFYLPSYSPELNPDEMLNANLKAAVTSQAPNRRKGQLKQRPSGTCGTCRNRPPRSSSSSRRNRSNMRLDLFVQVV
ncbi:MAG: transposase [Burkholderiales bacterium]|nr:transposase [Burkholderiales bacterium]